MVSPTRTPIAVAGAATAEQWPNEPGEGVDCAELMITAAQGAVADAGAGLGEVVDLVIATQGLSMLTDGAGRVATAIGRPDATAITYQVGIPQQTLLNHAFRSIRSGDARAVLVVGGETKRRDDLARRAGVELPPLAPFAGADDELIAPEGEIVARPEIDIGAVAPVQQYALIDSACRAFEGWTLDEHRDDIARLWAGFNEVAQTNPRAAFPAPMTAAEIREPSDGNRLLAFPYNKWHNSQWGVDQAAALLITSGDVVEAAGGDPDRLVYPLVAAESSQSLSLSRRAELHRWPAMGVLGAHAEAVLGAPLDTIEHVELYSCFPAAVRVQRAELGLGADAPATITGGMAFAGGPFNNFVLQATVAMIERLRANPGNRGLVTAVSGLLTKPGLTVWSTEPTVEVEPVDLVADARAATAVASLDEDPHGSGVIATYTTAGPRVSAIIDLDSGQRAVAACDDAALAERGTAEDLIGLAVSVEGRSFTV
jgi:acetyl-CoA C-acetyltransferase